MSDMVHKDIKLVLPDWLRGGPIEAKIRNGTYENKESEAAHQRVRSGMRVLELGAGLGFVSAICARKAGADRVVCVEANPRMLDTLRENLRLNDAKDVTVVHGAVVNAAYDEDTVLFRAGDLFWGGTIVETGTDLNNVVEVPALRLSDLLDAYRPRLVMMDIEGAEQYLFDARWPKFVKFVVLELHPSKYPPQTIQKIITCMSKSGLTYDPVSSNGRTLGFKRLPRKT